MVDFAAVLRTQQTRADLQFPTMDSLVAKELLKLSIENPSQAYAMACQILSSDNYHYLNLQGHTRVLWAALTLGSNNPLSSNPLFYLSEQSSNQDKFYEVVSQHRSNTSSLGIPENHVALFQRTARMQSDHTKLCLDVSPLNRTGLSFSFKSFSVPGLSSKVPGMDDTIFTYGPDKYIEYKALADGIFGVRLDINDRPAAVIAGSPVAEDAFMITQLQGVNRVVIQDRFELEDREASYQNPLRSIPEVHVRLMEIGIAMAKAHGFSKVLLQSGLSNRWAHKHERANEFLAREAPQAVQSKFDLRRSHDVYDRAAHELGFIRLRRSHWYKFL